MAEKKRFLAVVLAAAALIAPVAAVSASHIRIDGLPPAVPPPGVSQPAVVIPAPTQTLQVDRIEAGVVRANIIYANKLEADEVRGAVHQTRGLKVDDSRGKIKAPEVAVSVIYADEISANTVVADAIYVRELRRH